MFMWGFWVYISVAVSKLTDSQTVEIRNLAVSISSLGPNRIDVLNQLDLDKYGLIFSNLFCPVWDWQYDFVGVYYGRMTLFVIFLFLLDSRNRA